MFIYKITNIVNNKVYIGQTIRPVEKRFQRHINDSLNNVIDTHFSRAIRKYGKDNFEIEIIDAAESQDELNLKEQYWIRYYNSIDTQYGYNETDALYKRGGNTYQSKTEQEKEIIRDKLSKSKIGNMNPHSKSIKCFNVNTNQELFFDTVKDCKNYFNEKNHRFVTTRVLGKVKGLYRNEWKIAYADCEYLEFYPQRHKEGTHIQILDLETNQITLVDSVRLTSRQFNISRNDINKHLRNNEKNFIIQKYEITILD